ncbi:MAG: transporter substrate-binding domain-containing protein [bacterium]
MSEFRFQSGIKWWMGHSALLAILFFGPLWLASAQQAPLRVGIHEKPPYALKNPDGTWTGLAPGLWKGICDATGLQVEFVELPYEDLVQQVADGKIDAAAGEIEVTPEAEKLVDFTQPFLTSSLCIALTRTSWQSAWKNAIHDLFNWTVVKYLAVIFVAMLIVSVLLWFAERHHGTGHFHGGLTGIGSALWFSAVTMTTVGYGDKTPATIAGRIIAVFWMIFGVVLVSAFTATVTSSISAAKMANSIESVSDFNRLSCGALRGSLSAEVLKRIGVTTHEYESIPAAFEDLAAGKIEAVVGDRNTLLYVSREFSRRRPPVHINIPSFSLRQAFLAIPVRDGHQDYKKINQAMLQFTMSEEWLDLLQRWTSGSIPRF